MSGFYGLSEKEQLQLLTDTAQVALASWNLSDANLRLIKHRENAVFQVEDNDRQAALRLHRFGYHSDAELQSELLWMQALQEAGVLVPAIIPSASGDSFISVANDSFPQPLQVDMFEWIDGEQLGSVEEGVADESRLANTYQAIGEIAARVHNQASAWQLPDGFVRHAWDEEGLAGADPFWGEFWNLEAASATERRLLVRCRDRLFEDLRQLPKTPGEYSMIHADFAPENLMVDGDGVRLIDFDDAGFGWHLFELATSLYFIHDEPYFEQARDALIAGYRTQRELSDEHLELLPLHFLARGTTYLGWVHTRQETETARELTPMLLASACELANQYLQN